MKLYTISEVAARAGVGVDHVLSCHKWNLLGGQRVAGAYLFTEAQVEAWLSSETPPLDQPVLHSINTAAAMLGISTRQVRKAAESGSLPSAKVPTPGRHGWAYVFAEGDLTSTNLEPDRPGPEPKGAADAYIVQAGERYVIKGTHNRKGLPYSYKRLAVARRRARAAYDEGLKCHPGERTIVSVDGDKCSAIVLEGVTGIDQTIIVSIQGRRRVLRRSALPEITIQ